MASRVVPSVSTLWQGLRYFVVMLKLVG